MIKYLPEQLMEKEEFIKIRGTLSRTQKKMAELLGVSLKAVNGYEQGWRKVPNHAERQMLFLFSIHQRKKHPIKPCWQIKKCPSDRKKNCPAWEFRAGKICWFINGTICNGIIQNNWKEKMKICRSCNVLTDLLKY